MDHAPVLRDECVSLLAPAAPGLFIDATLGAGGHAAALLAARPDIRLLGLDRDPAALDLARERLAAWGDRVFFCAPTSPTWPPSRPRMRPAAREGC